MSQILCGNRMTPTDYIEEARECVLIIGGNRDRGDTYERVIWKVVALTGLPYSRLWAYLYRRVRRPTADDMDILRWARKREEALIKERWAHVALDNKWAEEVASFERLAGHVDEGAVRRGDAAAMPVAAQPHQDSGRTDQAMGRLLDAKAHRVGAR